MGQKGPGAGNMVPNEPGPKGPAQYGFKWPRAQMGPMGNPQGPKGKINKQIIGAPWAPTINKYGPRGPKNKCGSLGPL